MAAAGAKAVNVMSDDLRFTEIEHKFVVDDDFDLARFHTAIERLQPTRTTALRVRDRYFLTEAGRRGRFILRHRHDPELHHLTLKSLARDTEVRAEVNLDLGHHAGDQASAVDAFVERLGMIWRGVLDKDLTVWYFPDVEVAHYRATTGARAIECVEFEATRKQSLAAALRAVERYERATGFGGARRSHRSLPQLLFPEIAAALEEATGVSGGKGDEQAR